MLLAVMEVCEAEKVCHSRSIILDSAPYEVHGDRGSGHNQSFSSSLEEYAASPRLAAGGEGGLGESLCFLLPCGS